MISMQQASEAGHSCNCISPQNGQPVCPCRMKGVTIESGRYVEKRDLGPVAKAAADQIPLSPMFYSTIARACRPF